MCIRDSLLPPSLLPCLLPPSLAPASVQAALGLCLWARGWGERGGGTSAGADKVTAGLGG
eukprot:1311315-Rhodomonas_salina.1